MGQGPKTPEPSFPSDKSQLPSPPRPRLKLKRRQASHQLNAPTQHFLASVAAADVPVPSIEVDNSGTVEVYEHLHAQRFSPPKTPALETVSSCDNIKYPDWSVGSDWSCSDLESSPEYESSRPSTAFSTQTSASLFSQFSQASDDGDCGSPERKPMELHQLSSLGNAHVSHKERSRKAPWTKAMDSHLWSTYMLYLQDPRVTPIRLGRSHIPPNGVCLRVAREAKRSWKGSKTHLTADVNSGSTTPTAESSKPYIQWPHTCAATRAHLRELCRLNTATSPGHYKSPSPAPFHKAAHRRWNRRSAPFRSPSIFSAHDMALSLAMSTSEAMNPEGPLAQLASSETEPFPELKVDTELGISLNQDVPLATDLSYLPSPVLAKSYGPSSSSSLAADITLPRQSHTLGSRKLLKSPVRLTRSRSGTQKRRSVKNEDLPRKRPSLSADFWKDSPEILEQLSRDTHLGLLHGMPSELRDQSIDMFTPKTPDSNPTYPSTSLNHDIESPPVIPPRRLGSPFSSAGSSHSFPNRLSAPINFNLTAFRRPFATVQQSTQERQQTQSPRSTLASRLAYLDQRLRELRNRGNERRRSQSPL
ncbi:uncharacterized protein GGS25DRAFT_520567 [Hypoxylon fragiforme]|uniref:uncharacterized protein n=1 Tax=Hypoxylon fragiforme TaxID=63214 RepID=UPI0020C6BB5E|nr:uncharacterized protein GGS25DRAFT_520567 [Hypoxylon fragiforme]KAI2609759.1 hypothetical protein GGS25DRAFT_520567 [Hypoxylon fragiforme]